MFKTAKPAAQPRTLRTIAEDKGVAPAGMEGSTAYDSQAGVPMTERTSGQRYSGSVADQALPTTGATRVPSPADPKPFK